MLQILRLVYFNMVIFTFHLQLAVCNTEFETQLFFAQMLLGVSPQSFQVHKLVPFTFIEEPNIFSGSS